MESDIEDTGTTYEFICIFIICLLEKEKVMKIWIISELKEYMLSTTN